MTVDNATNQTQTSGKAIASLVLGILSLIVPYIGIILGILAVVFAKKAFSDIEALKYGGRGLAVGGLTCGIIGLALYTILLLFAMLIGGLAFIGI